MADFSLEEYVVPGTMLCVCEAFQKLPMFSFTCASVFVCTHALVRELKQQSKATSSRLSMGGLWHWFVGHCFWILGSSRLIDGWMDGSITAKKDNLQHNTLFILTLGRMEEDRRREDVLAEKLEELAP